VLYCCLRPWKTFYDTGPWDGITTHCITTHCITTHSITKLNIMAFSIKIKKCNIQHNDLRLSNKTMFGVSPKICNYSFKNIFHLISPPAPFCVSHLLKLLIQFWQYSIIPVYKYSALRPKKIVFNWTWLYQFH
jgi:hypothetical protein